MTGSGRWLRCWRTGWAPRVSSKGPLSRILATPESRPALEAWVRDSGTFRQAAASHPGARALQGRGRVHVVPAPLGGGHWVVRPYHRGGALASVLGDRYLRLGEPRPFHELRTGWRLEALGVPTPRHLGAAVYPSGLWYRCDLVTELVPRSRDLASVLFQGDGAADPAAAMTAAGRLLRLLHDRGVVHRDLNLKNVLIAEADPDVAGLATAGPVRALVLDLDRARVGDGVAARARRRMLDRFWRSARKWEAKTGTSLGPDLRVAFEAGYG